MPADFDETALSGSVQAVLAALRRCNVTELREIECKHIWRVKNEVLARPEPYPDDDEFTLGDVAPPAAEAACDVDEDGDEILEPTPLAEIDSAQGVRTAADEADGDW
jgi:hypothetical protein